MATTLKARLTKIETANRKRNPSKPIGCLVAYINSFDIPNRPSGMWSMGDEFVTPQEAKRRARVTGKTLIIVEYTDDAGE